MWVLVVPAAWAATPPDSGDTAAPVDTAALAVDDDGDGWTVGQGDCDDERAGVSPGVAEVCFDQVDNDCSGFADEQCDDTARLGSLKGGGACSGGGTVGGTATSGLLLLVPNALAFAFAARRPARRRRASR